MLRTLAIAGTLLLGLTSSASAFDDGRYNNVDPKIREWFKAQRAASGIPCCDIADGNLTSWRGTGNGGYEAIIEGEWIPIPPEAVIHDSGNPMGEAVVWYRWDWKTEGEGQFSKTYVVRCFVPGPEG